MPLGSCVKAQELYDKTHREYHRPSVLSNWEDVKGTLSDNHLASFSSIPAPACGHAEQGMLLEGPGHVPHATIAPSEFARGPGAATAVSLSRIRWSSHPQNASRLLAGSDGQSDEHEPLLLVVLRFGILSTECVLTRIPKAQNLLGGA